MAHRLLLSEGVFVTSGGVFMRLWRAIWLVLLLSFSATVASADSVPPDPSIIIRGGQLGSTPVGLSFSFQANSQGLGLLGPFLNDSDEDWFRLDIVTVPPDPVTPVDVCSTITGDSNVFANFTCSSIPNSGGQVLLSFFGVGTFNNDEEFDEESLFFPGILNGSDFTIDLGSDLANAWRPNEVFFARANNVPEPTTLALLLIGVGMLAARRRFRKSLHSRV